MEDRRQSKKSHISRSCPISFIHFLLLLLLLLSFYLSISVSIRFAFARSPNLVLITYILIVAQEIFQGQWEWLEFNSFIYDLVGSKTWIETHGSKFYVKTLQCCHCLYCFMGQAQMIFDPCKYSHHKRYFKFSNQPHEESSAGSSKFLLPILPILIELKGNFESIFEYWASKVRDS